LLKAIGYYSHAPHNDVSVNDGPHIGRWSHNIIIQYNIILGTAVAQWLRCCATNRKVADSIWIFHWHKNTSDRTMARGRLSL